MAKILGIVVEHGGHEYLVSVDESDLPDLLARNERGEWETLKQRGPGGRAGPMAYELLGALGQGQQEGHTQQQIKSLVLHCVTDIITRFFRAARW